MIAAGTSNCSLTYSGILTCLVWTLDRLLLAGDIGRKVRRLCGEFLGHKSYVDVDGCLGNFA